MTQIDVGCRPRSRLVQTALMLADHAESRCRPAPSPDTCNDRRIVALVSRWSDRADGQKTAALSVLAWPRPTSPRTILLAFLLHGRQRNGAVRDRPGKSFGPRSRLPAEDAARRRSRLNGISSTNIAPQFLDPAESAASWLRPPVGGSRAFLLRTARPALYSALGGAVPSGKKNRTSEPSRPCPRERLNK